MSYIEAGVKQGAKLECGGKRHGTTGYYIQPTVFSNVEDFMKIAEEEVRKLDDQRLLRIVGETLMF